MKVLILIHCMMYFLTDISAQGLFTISPDNASSFNISDFSLRKVIIPPLIILEPSEYTISFREGEAFELPCAATGIPEPTYTWSCEDRDFDPSGMDGRIAVQQGVGTLIFLDPLPFDAAFYQCTAKNQAGIAVSRRINVRMAVLDDFPVARLRINTPEIGYHLMLECLPPRSFPNPRVYWTLQTSESPSVKIDYTDRVSQDPIGNLIFANVVAADYQNNATYVCVARNEVLGTFKQGKLNKIYPSGVTPVPHKPTLAWQSPTRQFGLRGKSVTIKCIFYGNPTPRVMWKRVTPPGADMPENSYIASFGQELVFTNLQYEDEGAYECEGINDEGLVPVRRSFSLAVQSAPYWIEKPQSQDVEEGATVVFKCAGESKPPPKILWYFNNIPVTNIRKNPRIFISQNKVTFTNVTIKDPMVVQCNISNNHGYNFTNAYINVLTEPPIILKKPIIGQKAAEGQTIELLCDVQGSPKPFVVWTKGNEQLTGGRFSVMNNGNLKITDLSLVDAGVYTCTATNKLGKADATGSLIVRPSTETTAKATGLNPNTTYRIYVAASTKAGKGEPIFVDSVTSSGYPDPPTFTIVDLNETFANITWQPSRSEVPGSVFYVQYKPRYHYDWRRSPDEYMAQHMSLRSLDPGTTYQVRVVAKNGDGYETASIWQEFLTPGVAPGYFDLNTSAWFYGIWISLFLILLGVILLMLLKKYTNQKWDEKDECYIVRPMDYDSVPSHGYP